MATFLTTVTYFLLQNPEKLGKLRDEIRRSFSKVSQIDDASLHKMPYLAAVIEETLRIFPPFAAGLPRISPGAVVDGNYIPKGVCLLSYAAASSLLRTTKRVHDMLT